MRLLSYFLLFTLLSFLPYMSVQADDIDDFGQGKKLLVINPLKTEILLTDVERRMINKVTIKVCAKQRDFQIALGEIGIAKNAQIEIFNIELELLKVENGITVKVLLLDEIKKQVVAKSSISNVEKLHLMRTVETALDNVFTHQKK